MFNGRIGYRAVDLAQGEESGKFAKTARAPRKKKPDFSAWQAWRWGFV
jgi:hypothetical protein